MCFIVPQKITICVTVLSTGGHLFCLFVRCHESQSQHVAAICSVNTSCLTTVPTPGGCVCLCNATHVMVPTPGGYECCLCSAKCVTVPTHGGYVCCLYSATRVTVPTPGGHSAGVQPGTRTPDGWSSRCPAPPAQPCGTDQHVR